MSSLAVAADQINADTRSTVATAYRHEHPTGQYPDAPSVLSDLGDLDGLFGRGFLDNIAHAAATPLETATSAKRGPNGGLIPTFHLPPLFQPPVDGASVAQHVEAYVPRFRDTVANEAQRLVTAVRNVAARR